MIENDDAPQATLTVSPRSHRRLAVAVSLSAGIVCLAIVLLPASWRDAARDLDYTVDVRVLQTVQETPPVAEPEIEPESEQPTEQLADEQPAESEAIVPDSQHPEDQAAPERSPQIDWYAALDRVAIESVKPAGKSESMSPKFDQLRNVARVRYRESEAPVKKPIWENVEKDQMGRTILRAGDCYRVLDDPSVANRWAQENFTQYILFCGNGKELPKELPFVADIVARYAYLRPEDAMLNADAPH